MRKEVKHCMSVSVIIPTRNRSNDVICCISSVLKSDYADIEVIVVDNASVDDTIVNIENKFGDKVKLIKAEVNLGAGGGRNRGAKEAGGDYLLFIDSDNVIDNNMVGMLVSFFNKHDDCGMVGPLMLYKENPCIIWLYYANINMFTSQAIYNGTGEKDEGQYDEIIEVGHLPNCFMVRKDHFHNVGEFDEKYVIMYEEADLAERIKKNLKKKIYLYTKAKTLHNVELPEKNDETDNYLFISKYRAYLTARNRVYFMKKNVTLIKYLSFFFLFNPLIFCYYEIKLLKRGEIMKAWYYFKGTISGIRL